MTTKTLTPIQARILDLIEHRALLLGQIAYVANISRSAAERNLRKLELRGLVTVTDGYWHRTGA